MAGWFIGLMSGTSLDGVDGVLAEALDPNGALQSRAHAHVGFSPALRAELLALNSRHGNDELHRAALAANALVACYVQVIEQIRRQVPGQPIVAIGAHGQTVRHRPGQFDASGYTLQLINGALLAEQTGIDVVCDFRSRDVAAGGQGAPLVPAFHAAQFGKAGQDRAVLNLGGIANLTLLHADGAVLGFDCGPANVLMDLWCQRCLGQSFDVGGAWAAAGRVDVTLLAAMSSEPFFALAPPKSTGRDLFDAAWLDARLAGRKVEPQDVMATLSELTARGVTDALKRHAPRTTELVVCGGGAFNTQLLARIAALLDGRIPLRSSADLGVEPDQVEALAFAWLAQAFLQRRPGNLPAVTGARGARVLGALYPAQ